MEWVIAIVLIALAPGLLAWWWGRRLVRLADDPALPERLQSYGQRLALATGLAGAAGGVLAPAHLPWFLPLLVVAVLAGDFPSRRVLWEVGAEAVTETRWRLPEGEDPDDARYVATRGAALALGPVRRPVGGVLERLGLPGRAAFEWERRRLDAADGRPLVTSALAVRCLPPRLGDAGFLCLAHDRGVRTLLWSLDGETGARRALGVVPGVIGPAALGSDGRLAAQIGRGGALVDARRGAAVRFALPGAAGRLRDLALEVAGLGVLAGPAGRGGNATVTVYDIR